MYGLDRAELSPSARRFIDTECHWSHASKGLVPLDLRATAILPLEGRRPLVLLDAGISMRRSLHRTQTHNL